MAEELGAAALQWHSGRQKAGGAAAGAVDSEAEPDFDIGSASSRLSTSSLQPELDRPHDGARGATNSRRREFCHFTATPFASMLKHLLKGEGDAAE